MRAAALLLTMACAAPALAQITRGGICGTVRDASGAVVSGAGVTATRVDTNVARRSVSDELGFYRTGALDPGVYVVRAELAGFTAAEARDIGVRSATDTTVDMVLKVAAVGEAITVTEQVAGVELNKTSPTVGFTDRGKAGRRAAPQRGPQCQQPHCTLGQRRAGPSARAPTPSTASAPATTTTWSTARTTTTSRSRSRPCRWCRRGWRSSRC